MTPSSPELPGVLNTPVRPRKAHDLLTTDLSIGEHPSLLQMSSWLQPVLQSIQHNPSQRHPFVRFNTFFRDFYTLHNETVSHKSVTIYHHFFTHWTFFITIFQTVNVTYVPVVWVNVFQKLYAVSNFHKYCQCSPPCIRLDIDNLLQYLGHSETSVAHGRGTSHRANNGSAAEWGLRTYRSLSSRLFFPPAMNTKCASYKACSSANGKARSGGKKRVNRENERKKHDVTRPTIIVTAD